MILPLSLLDLARFCFAFHPECSAAETAAVLKPSGSVRSDKVNDISTEPMSNEKDSIFSTRNSLKIALYRQPTVYKEVTVNGS